MGWLAPSGRAKKFVLSAWFTLLGLAVVFLAGDPGALDVLRLMQPGPLAGGNDAVGPGPVLDVGDMLLAALQAAGLAGGQAAGSDTPLDALFLIQLALVDAGRRGLGQREQRQGEDETGGET